MNGAAFDELYDRPTPYPEVPQHVDSPRIESEIPLEIHPSIEQRHNGQPSPASSRPPPPPVSTAQKEREAQKGREPSNLFGGVSNLAFTGELKAAVEARLGLPTGGGSGLLSMSYAPFFPTTSPGNQPVDLTKDVDYVLPSRKQANRLTKAYFKYIHPLEPFLEEKQFLDSYDHVFSGTLLNTDERIFISTLNVVFALATQFSDDRPAEQRDQASSAFFHRAWDILHQPNLLILESTCHELVPCLLLMASYLKCSNNPHQTFMIAGTAILVAQSLGLHRTDQSRPSNLKTRRAQHIWLCCIYTDRYISSPLP